MIRPSSLYPRWWRERYGAELDQLVADLDVDWRLRLDVVRGALAEHAALPGARLGALYGTVAGLAVAIDILLSNVVYPPWGEHSLVVYLAIAGCLFLAGGHAGRRWRDPATAARTGVVAAVVVVAIAFATFFAVDNVFLDVVGRQPQKVAAAAGWPSMRLYVNASLAVGLLILLPALSALGAACGCLGTLAARPLTSRATRSPATRATPRPR
jgi:hypothetical protein